MQVLYQLSYGPIDVATVLTTPQVYNVAGGGHTWRQTATSLPWMVTSSAGTRIGA